MHKPLSVGIVTGSMSRHAGGLFNSVRKSAINLAKDGVGVEVFSVRDAHSESDYPEWAPIKPHLLDRKGPAAIGYAPKLSQVLAHGNYDLLHLHGIWQWISAAVNRWKRDTGKPVMISPRGMLDPWALNNSGWKKKLAGAVFENRNLRDADCLHALNQSEADAMRDYGLANPIAIIPNGADLPDAIVPARDLEKQTLLFLGRIHPKKGLSELVRAWSQLGKDNPAIVARWELAIAGWDDGGHLGALKEEVAQHGIGDTVRFTGPAFGQDKDQLLRSADAFILPSHSEGLPMSVLEAWAYGLPVFMTRQCNLPIGFNSNAAIEITTDSGLMAQTLAAGLAEADLRAIGAAGRELVEQHFAWPRIAAEHRRVYEWMRGQGDRPDCVMVD